MNDRAEAQVQSLAPRSKPPLLVRYGIWLLLALTALLFAAAETIPSRTRITAAVRLQGTRELRAGGAGRVHLLVNEGAMVGEHQPVAVVESSRTYVVASREIAAKIHVPQPATIVVASARHPVVIERVFPGDGDTLLLQINGTSLPANAPATLEIAVSDPHLARQIVKSFTP